MRHASAGETVDYQSDDDDVGAQRRRRKETLRKIAATLPLSLTLLSSANFSLRGCGNPSF